MIRQLSSTVVFLYSDAGVALGTAFIVGYPMAPGGDAFIPLVVTAKHVIDGQRHVVARFKNKSTTGGQGSPAKTLDVKYDLHDLRAAGDLWEPSDVNVDLVVFRTIHPNDADYISIPISMVASKQDYETNDIKETDRIVFPSLLVGLKGLSRDYPVVRDGTIALIPEEGIPVNGGGKQELVLINAAANQGSSGAPIYLWPGPRLHGNAFAIGGTTPLLLGLIKGFFRSIARPVTAIDGATGQPIPFGLTTPTTPPRPAALIFEEDSRIGIYTPSWLLREMLESHALKARMKALGAKD